MAISSIEQPMIRVNRGAHKQLAVRRLVTEVVTFDLEKAAR
jgi:hypothetical protein